MQHNPDSDDDNGSIEDTVVIGIDFGTTGQINLITAWPGTGRDEGKVPTELLYKNGEVLWGYEIPPDAKSARWFKLLLLRDEDLSAELRKSEYIQHGRDMLSEMGKSAIDVTADYLRMLSQHTLETIRKSRGESVVDALRFHIVITVPAIWKDYARQSMKEAVQKAGLLKPRAAGPTTLAFSPEPGGRAALATLCEPGRKTEKDDVFIICDAGGGTVDLISYKIDSTGPIAMHEAVEGSGDLCGGIFIDEAFEKLCKSRLGNRWNNLSTAGIREIITGEWETAIKPQYKPKARKSEYIVRIPAEAFRHSSLDDLSKEPIIKNGRVHFTGKHIQGTFTDSFSRIDRLIDDQVDMATGAGLNTTGIILVGGLGASPYLYMHLKKKYTAAGIDVLQSTGINPQGDLNGVKI
ncbi:hsp70 family chaperone [Grosmannia clavigera kw1407]|uniref:Hsp70 family chaperone n=1 Tax=Grosmannia clavigera (strain kw1407 / UAMH 11150) TaxID=655863 RepID=F0XKY1_GROCL|nr:hsp70 family chaperone [Grosmannia clavigera kw1407]EFX01732.1 hsp70 family chaperone [Grosmannia clavigera kw1407]